MLQKSGRLVLWEAMFILELHSAETQVFYGNRHCRSILIQKFVQLRLYDLLFLHLGSTDHFSLCDDHIHISKHP